MFVKKDARQFSYYKNIIYSPKSLVHATRWLDGPNSSRGCYKKRLKDLISEWILLSTSYFAVWKPRGKHYFIIIRKSSLTNDAYLKTTITRDSYSKVYSIEVELLNNVELLKWWRVN